MSDNVTVDTPVVGTWQYAVDRALFVAQVRLIGREGLFSTPLVGVPDTCISENIK